MVSDERRPRAWVEAREGTNRGDVARAKRDENGRTMSGSRIVSASGVAADDDDDDEATTTTTTTMTTRDANADDEGAAPTRRGAGGHRGDGLIIMRRLIERGHVRPGPGVLSTTLFKKETRADLREDGTVEWRRDDGETLTFKTVSEFRLAVVRERNPERKVDNGWDWVKYEGKKLGEYKRLLQPPPPPSSPKKREPRAPKSSTPKKRRKKLDDDERMYSMNVKISNAPVREKRERRSASRGVFEAFDDRGQDLQMVTCSKYNGRSRKQPFEITITRAAELVMDFHAHLCSDEIIGFLGGVYDASTETLRVTRALPARQIRQEHAGVEVELDPESVPAIVETLTANGERVVGWYHSHPVFATQPSLRDIENQFAYQLMFSSDAQESAPFVGAIVGPYDEENDSSASDVRMFHCVLSAVDDEPEPFELATRAAEEDDVVGEDVLLEMKKLADRFRLCESAEDEPTPLSPIDLNATPIELTEHWRDGKTRLRKLMESIRTRLPKSWDGDKRDEFVDRAVTHLKSRWGVA